MKEIIVIGGGIIGSFIAHDLSKYDAVHVSLLEKNADVADEVTAANSAIVHAGYDPKDGTLKALLNKRGADMYPSICEELHVDYKQCGALVLACGEEEERTLEKLYQQGVKRHVKVSYLKREEIFHREPNVSERVTKAMDVPETAIISPWEVCYALMDEFILNGGELFLQEEVLSIHKDTRYHIMSNKGIRDADIIINAAGMGAQHIMEMVEDTALFTITPKRGQYFVLSKKEAGFVKEVMYPVPTTVGKGVLTVPTTHGNILLGPNSEWIKDEDTSTTAKGLANVRERLTKTIKDVPYQEVIHSYSGLRPCGNDNDFFIQTSPEDDAFIHCGCIDSPGLASAPAISEYVIDKFVKQLMTLSKKEQYVSRAPDIRMSDLSLDEKQEQIKKNHKYGHIICRCEEISEQEVIDSIHRPCGATSIKGVKKRVRPGMGKCQGGFCEIEVANILAHEMQTSLDTVRYDKTMYFTKNKGVK